MDLEPIYLPLSHVYVRNDSLNNSVAFWGPLVPSTCKNLKTTGKGDILRLFILGPESILKRFRMVAFHTEPNSVPLN